MPRYHHILSDISAYIPRNRAVEPGMYSLLEFEPECPTNAVSIELHNDLVAEIQKFVGADCLPDEHIENGADISWDSMTSDMIGFSKKYPGLVFEISVDGEGGHSKYRFYWGKQSEAHVNEFDVPPFKYGEDYDELIDYYDEVLEQLEMSNGNGDPLPEVYFQTFEKRYMLDDDYYCFGRNSQIYAKKQAQEGLWKVLWLEKIYDENLEHTHQVLRPIFPNLLDITAGKYQMLFDRYIEQIEALSSRKLKDYRNANLANTNDWVLASILALLLHFEDRYPLKSDEK